MKLFKKDKDGGPNSPVDGYFLIEVKSLFSIALLKFNQGAREEFHTHAFNAFTWFIRGDLTEEKYDGTFTKYQKSFLPKFTSRENNHRVIAKKDSWCLTIRGPWNKYWTEDNKDTNLRTTFGWGREIKGEQCLKI